MDNDIILNSIKLNLDRLLDKEWPKLEKAIEGHEDRLRSLELFQVKLDGMIPRIDSIANEIKKNNQTYAQIEEMKKLESNINDLRKEIDSLKSFMWKMTGALSILAFVIPLAMKFM